MSEYLRGDFLTYTVHTALIIYQYNGRRITLLAAGLEKNLKDLGFFEKGFKVFRLLKVFFRFL